MAQHVVELSLAVDKWDMEWGKMYMGWSCWGVESSNGLCDIHPLLCCPFHENREMDIVSKDERENQSQIIQV